MVKLFQLVLSIAVVSATLVRWNQEIDRGFEADLPAPTPEPTDGLNIRPVYSSPALAVDSTRMLGSRLDRRVRPLLMSFEQIAYPLCVGPCDGSDFCCGARGPVCCLAFGEGPGTSVSAASYVCCSAGNFCCTNGGCCPSGSTCCGSSCCASGFICSSGACVNPTQSSQSVQSLQSIESLGAQSQASVQSIQSIDSVAIVSDNSIAYLSYSMQSVASVQGVAQQSQASVASVISIQQQSEQAAESQNSIASVSLLSMQSLASLAHTTVPTPEPASNANAGTSTALEANNFAATTSSNHKGAVIGGAVGGTIGGLALIAFVAFCFVRQKQRKAETDEVEAASNRMSSSQMATSMPSSSPLPTPMMKTAAESYYTTPPVTIPAMVYDHPSNGAYDPTALGQGHVVGQYGRPTSDGSGNGLTMWVQRPDSVANPSASSDDPIGYHPSQAQSVNQAATSLYPKSAAMFYGPASPPPANAADLNPKDEKEKFV